jgi:hypothetical protein
MMRAVMESAGLTFWPVFSLVLFCLFAAALVAWLYRRGSGDFYQGMARLALEQDGAGKPHARRDDGKQG